MPPALSVDLAVRCCPIGFAHRFAVELPGRRRGNFRHEVYGLGRLHATQFCLAMSDDLALGERLATLQNDESLDSLSPLIVGYTYDGALLNLGQRHDAGFDLDTVDVKASADNHIFLAVDDVDISMLVDVSHIAGMVPTMPADLGRGLRQFMVARREQRAIGYDFSNLVRGKDLASIVHDGETNRRRGLAATAEALRMISGCGRRYSFRVEKSEEHGSFGLSERLTHARAEDFHTLLKFVG